jgi:hypothetical protein
MAWVPRFAILPRFRALNMLNLLLLQAEISRKEKMLREWVLMDERPGDTCRADLSLDIEGLLALDDDDPRLKLTQDVRRLLAEYSMSFIIPQTLNIGINAVFRYSSMSTNSDL